jgi:hypothetical protein
MKVEGPRFSFRVAPEISEAEWAEMSHAVCKIIVLGRPQTPSHRRAVVIRQLLHLFPGSARHRLARVNGGRSLRWRRIFDIAAAFPQG